jgi:hypothetical protein
LAREPHGKRKLRSPRRRWEDNIKMNIKEIGFRNVIWLLENLMERERLEVQDVDGRIILK